MNKSQARTSTRTERGGLWAMMRAFAWLLVLVTAWVPTHAAVLLEDATLVAAESSSASRGFQISQPGRYELQLSDVGLPAPLTSLQASITRGDRRVAVLGAPGAVQFDAASGGQYEVQIAGVASTASGFGSFAVRVVAVPSGAIALDYSDAVSTPQPEPPAGQATIQTQVVITDAASHRITLADLAFPEDLASVDLLLTKGGVQVARLSKSTPEVDFPATPGTYDMLMVAQAAAGSAGLFGVRIVNLATGSGIYDSSVPVGRLGSPVAVNLPAAASYALIVADLQFPVALASTAAAVVRGSELLGKQTSSGAVAFNAPAGDVAVFALPTPAVPSEVGAMSVELSQGSNRISSLIVPLSPPSTSSGTSVYEAQVTPPSAGGYRATLTDFQFPAPFGALELAIYQGDEELGRRTGVGTLDVQADDGVATILVAATPGAADSGLFGIQLAASPAGTVVFEATQASGAIFERRMIDIATSGSYDVRVSDLQFPVAFPELAAAVTRGTQRVGFVYGGGTFSFDATPGTYFLNFITRVDPDEQFGTYGLAIETTPPSPTVTLTANPSEVTSGSSITLTWTSTDASNCVASGQWTGSKALSGSESVGPLAVDSTFTLVCTGSGGSTTRSATVGVRPPKSGGGGGGGASDPWALLLLLLLGAASLAARTRTRARSPSA